MPYLNSLFPGRFELNFRFLSINFKLILVIDDWGIVKLSSDEHKAASFQKEAMRTHVAS